MSPEQLFIRGDLNDLYEGVIPLRNTVWIALLKKGCGENLDGQHIWLYEKLAATAGVTLGFFRGSTNEDGEYEIAVNDEDFRWLSEYEESKEYAVDDLGFEFAEEHKRQFGR